MRSAHNHESGFVPFVAVRMFPPHPGRNTVPYAALNESVSAAGKSSAGIPNGKDQYNRHKCYPFTLGKAKNIKGLQAQFWRKKSQKPIPFKNEL